MNEGQLLRRLCGGDTEALGAVMDGYTAYVYAIARNIIDPPLGEEDAEELVSDVFVTLWKNATQVREGKLKAWLAAVTRNKARDRLRALRLCSPLDREALDFSLPGPEDGLLRQELIGLARQAVESMGEPDRAIFSRRYFLYQKTDEIAAALAMNPATVRTRLARGREKLKDFLRERGYSCEAVDH